MARRYYIGTSIQPRGAPAVVVGLFVLGCLLMVYTAVTVGVLCVLLVSASIYHMRGSQRREERDEDE